MLLIKIKTKFCNITNISLHPYYTLNSSLYAAGWIAHLWPVANGYNASFSIYL